MKIYDHSANAILAKAIPNWQEKPISSAWEDLHKRLMQHGHETKTIMFDNKYSRDLKESLKKHDKKYKHTPPHIHWQNAAEFEIRTFKKHVLSGFATCDGEFPIAEWDRLLMQTELTLNLLRMSQVNKKLSAYAYLFGNFDFNRTPLAPPDTKVLIHEKIRIVEHGTTMASKVGMLGLALSIIDASSVITPTPLVRWIQTHLTSYQTKRPFQSTLTYI